MEQCTECGTSAEDGFTCSYCGARHCSTHRLPEDHSCPNIDEAKPPGRSRVTNRSEASNASSREASKRPPTEGTVSQVKTDHQSPKPEALDSVQTYGGSGRDPDNADFVSSPDVAPDGSLEESEVEEVDENQQQVEEKVNWQRRLALLALAAGLAAVFYFVKTGL